MFLKIKKLLKLSKNNFFLHFYNVFGSFILLQLFSQRVSLSTFGQIGFLISIYRLTDIFVLGGFNHLGIKLLTKNLEKKFRNRKIIINIQTCQLINVLSCFFIILLLTIFNFNLRIYFIIILCTIHHIFFPQYIFQATNKLYEYSLCILFSRIFLYVFAFLTIDSSTPILNLAFLSISNQLVGCLLYNLFVFFGFFDYNSVTLPRLKLIQLKQAIIFYRSNCAFQFSGILNTIYVTLPTIVAKFFLNSSDLGIFFGAERIMRLFHLILVPLSNTLYNLFSKKIFESLNSYLILFKKIKNFYLLVTPVLSVILILSSPYMINIIYGLEFKDSIRPLTILYLIVPFSFLWDLYGRQGLILLGKASEHFYVSLIVCLTFIFLAFAFSSTELNSSSFALFYVFSECLSFILCSVLFKKNINNILKPL